MFKIYEGTHLAITKINPSNFLNVGVSSVCIKFYNLQMVVYIISHFILTCIFFIVSYGQLEDRCINDIISCSFSLLCKTDHISDTLGYHFVCHAFVLTTF